jgi:hypothetical protein
MGRSITRRGEIPATLSREFRQRNQETSQYFADENAGFFQPRLSSREFEPWADVVIRLSELAGSGLTRAGQIERRRDLRLQPLIKLVRFFQQAGHHFGMV